MHIVQELCTQSVWHFMKQGKRVRMCGSKKLQVDAILCYCSKELNEAIIQCSFHREEISMRIIEKTNLLEILTFYYEVDVFECVFHF